MIPWKTVMTSPMTNRRSPQTKLRSFLKKNHKVLIVCVVVLAVLLCSALWFFFSKKSGVSDDYDKKWVDEASPDSVLGQWEASDEKTFTIDVWKDENGLYHAVINRKKHTDTVAFWEMSSKGVASDGETLEYLKHPVSVQIPVKTASAIGLSISVFITSKRHFIISAHEETFPST